MFIKFILNKPYKHIIRGSEKQKKELQFYNNFVDDIAKHIITNNPPKSKNKK